MRFCMIATPHTSPRGCCRKPRLETRLNPRPGVLVSESSNPSSRSVSLHPSPQIGICTPGPSNRNPPLSREPESGCATERAGKADAADAPPAGAACAPSTRADVDAACSFSTARRCGREKARSSAAGLGVPGALVAKRARRRRRNGESDSPSPSADEYAG